MGVRTRTAPMPELQDSASYLDFFATTLDFGLFPHLSRNPLAAAAKLNGKEQAWQRIQEQVSEGVRNPEWYRKDLADELGLRLAQLFHRIADCRLPLRMADGFATNGASRFLGRRGQTCCSRAAKMALGLGVGQNAGGEGRFEQRVGVLWMNPWVANS